MPTYYPGHPNDPATAGRFPQLVESLETIINDVEPTYASNGAVRVRRKTPKLLREFSVAHILKTTDKETLITFYLNNRNGAFEFHFRPTETSITKAIFIGPPTLVLMNGDYWQVTTNIAEI
jgi:hypothetical protein